MNWRTPLLATLLALSVTSCNLLPQSNTVSEDAQLLTNQVPSPRGLGDPNAPVKISEYTDYQ